MTTEGTGGTQPKRTVVDIVNAGTYQGCTDEEIQSVIDYYVALARNDEQTRTAQASYIVQMNESISLAEEQARKAEERVRSLLTERPRLVTIGEDGFPTGGDA